MSESVVRRTILVVENESLMRELLCQALNDAGFSPIQARTATEASKIFSLHDPDGALIDIDLGDGPNGFALATRLRRQAPHLPLVFLTCLVDPRLANAAEVPTDAHFVLKTRLKDIDELVSIIDGSMRGSSTSFIRHDKDTSNPLASLTRAQVEVLRLIAEGLSNEQIAKARSTTLRAVEFLVSRTLKRLGIDDRAGNRRALAARAFR